MNSVLIAVALQSESQGLLETTGAPVLYTGVGKINATYALTQRLAELRHAGLPMPHVVNFGSAGSRSLARGAVVACNAFVQRDMNVSALGFDIGTTPFDDTPKVIEFATAATLPYYTCSSGDSFETGAAEASGPLDVIDMEAYALAKVCLLSRAQFSCVKFITDGADESAATDWLENLKHAATQFVKVYEECFA